jgi:hypothetical protein
MRSVPIIMLLFLAMVDARAQAGSAPLIALSSVAVSERAAEVAASSNASVLTDKEKNTVLALHRSQLSINGVCMYAVFAESGITKKICELESKKSSYSFNIPPSCKLVAVHVTWVDANRHVRITGYNNVTDAWKKVSGVCVDDGVAFTETISLAHPATSLR